MSENKKYLTIHGHFYQPPRENPWIEEVEMQESAAPEHDWNEKICAQCYAPNGVSRMVNGNNQIIEISNNYEYISFNFGPTLLSWMEKHDPFAYERIIQADINSRQMYNGHGCAIAQVYNHIIMPLANRNDKITQVIWGLKDFQKRFNRNSEGIWLAETAVDAQTLEVLIDCGVKFTILSPHQAKCINKIGERNWQDVSWGSIDPSQPYRYFVEGTDKQKYIDLFFYDGSISKSVAFDNLLQDGKKFAHRLNDGWVESRNRDQLINIATDGESYGHHTKFGDMALAYIVQLGAKELGFEITNYACYLENHPPQYEVDIKPVSAWSCAHGVGRWMEDCGCSTGAQPHWNQKWRKPLRQALDYLRDELIKLCSIEGTKYYNDFWESRNNYIDVILDRSEENINKFIKENCKKLNAQEKIKAIKLMEIQRYAQLMYTSCGWFFADISGIETVQIMKYAARAIELAKDFSKDNYEKTFLSVLQKAKSNIARFGSGKDIYNNWVKPSAIGFDEIVAQDAIETIFNDSDINEKVHDLYCYSLKRSIFKKCESENYRLYFGKVAVRSNITLEKKDFSYVILQTRDYEIFCGVKDFTCIEDFNVEKKEIQKMIKNHSLEDILKTIQVYYEKRLHTLKDIPIDRRKTILENLIIKKLKQVSKTYNEMYDNLLNPITYLNDLGMDIPEGFRVCAKYTLLSNLEKELLSMENYHDKNKIKNLEKIKKLADKFSIKLTTPKVREVLSKKLINLLLTLRDNLSFENTHELLNLFELLELLQTDINIQNAQNIFYSMACEHFDELINKVKNTPHARKLLLEIIEIGNKLNINLDFYKEKIDKITGKV